METGSTRLHVVPSLDSGWTICESADGRALRRTTTRRGAVQFATLHLERRGGELVIRAADGEIVETRQVPAAGPRPWWYVPTAHLWVVVGIINLVQGILHLVWTTPNRFPTLWSVMGVLGAYFLVVAVLSLRYDRHRRRDIETATADAQPDEVSGAGGGSESAGR